MYKRMVHFQNLSGVLLVSRWSASAGRALEDWVMHGCLGLFLSLLMLLGVLSVFFLVT
jgi:hypothetical protein